MRAVTISFSLPPWTKFHRVWENCVKKNQKTPDIFSRIRHSNEGEKEPVSLHHGIEDPGTYLRTLPQAPGSTSSWCPTPAALSAPLHHPLLLHGCNDIRAVGLQLKGFPVAFTYETWNSDRQISSFQQFESSRMKPQSSRTMTKRFLPENEIFAM